MKFGSDFYRNNRAKLAEALPNSLVVVAAHAQLQLSSDIPYPFRQDSSFWYLCGINEPDLVLVVDTKTGKSCLLLPEQNDYQKEWDGKLNERELKKRSGVESVAGLSELQGLLRQAKKQSQQICHLAPLPEKVEPYGFYSNPARRLLLEQIQEIEAKPKDVRRELARLRQIKSDEELEAITQAIKITADTLRLAKEGLNNFKTENELNNFITAQFYSSGAEGHGYEPIIASGANAATIHYKGNAAPIKNNTLLLLDVGAKVSGYSADISRTWVVGKASDRQKVVFDAVVWLQQQAFSALKPGVKIREYQQMMEELTAKELKKLGVVAGKYPHGFSHFLGLDVHDAGDYEQPLQAGSVLTVEPGIYLPDEKIGVRIEDNVLITKNGIENLSADIPVEL